jgi:hypothetical protein
MFTKQGVNLLGVSTGERPLGRERLIARSPFGDQVFSGYHLATGALPRGFVVCCPQYPAILRPNRRLPLLGQGYFLTLSRDAYATRTGRVSTGRPSERRSVTEPL